MYMDRDLHMQDKLGCWVHYWGSPTGEATGSVDELKVNFDKFFQSAIFLRVMDHPIVVSALMDVHWVY